MVMLGGISHDVRTYATRLRLSAEKINDAAERDRAIADINDMIVLLDDALLASRAGAGELAEEMVEIDDIIAAEVADRRSGGASWPTSQTMRSNTASCASSQCDRRQGHPAHGRR
jgi:signal transduction histidine kinase